MNIWIAINKDQTLSLHMIEPTRGNSRWQSTRPYVNSLLYKSLNDLVKRSKMTWESDPEFIIINPSDVREDFEKSENENS